MFFIYFTFGKFKIMFIEITVVYNIVFILVGYVPTFTNVFYHTMPTTKPQKFST